MKLFTEKDFTNWEERYRTNFFNSIGGFKSCNVIGTRSKKGNTNLGLFFSVVHVGSNPPMAGVLFRPHSVPRHTLENILETKFFTINSVQESWVEEAHGTSAKFDAKVSEFDELDLRESYHDGFFAPYVERSRVKYGLEYVEHHTVKANGTIFLVGRVVEAWIDTNAMTSDGFIAHTEVDTVAVNGLDTYFSTKKEKRFKYARPESPASEKDED